MCSIGALLHGVKSSSSPSSTSSLVCNKRPMLDNVRSSKRMVHQSIGGGSIATALRDHRQSCVIPIQPNRSLPVHPAPHHTHCRSNNIVVRGTSQSLVRTAAAFVTTSSPVSQSCDAQTLVDSCINEAIGRDETGQNESPRRKAKIEMIENELIESLEDLVREDSNWSTRIMWRDHRCVDGKTEDQQDLIDISRSPERSVIQANENDNQEVHSTGQQEQVLSSGSFINEEFPVKRKRKRRGRPDNGSTRRGNQDIRTERNDRCKIVPPLRLKKISDLRELIEGAADLQTRQVQVDSVDRGVTSEDRRGSPGHSSKYRVVTGHTPPYDDPPIDARRNDTRELGISSLDAAKLKYKKSKLIVKLGQLRSKAVELGNEMLRTVLSSSNGPRAKKEQQIRQKLNRYKNQIENLEKVLTELPEVTSYIEDSAVESRAYDSLPPKRRSSTHRDPEKAKLSSRLVCSSNSSSRHSSPCLEPPKLSPKLPTNYETVRSPSELRNSPPILPPAYVTLTDCTDDSSDEKTTSSGRKRRSKQRRSSASRNKSKIPTCSIASPIIIGEVIKNDCENDFEREEVVATSSTTDDRVEIAKSDVDVSSSNSPDVMEVYDEPKIPTETKLRLDNLEIIEPTIKRSASPLDIVIEKSSNGADETKHVELRIIDEVRGKAASTDSVYETSKDEKEDCKEKSAKDVVVTLRDEDIEETNANDVSICERFPTLASWIATLSNNQVIEDNTKLPEVPVVVEQPSAFQVITPDAVKTIEVQNTVRNTVNENHPAGAEQWRNEQWQEAPAQQQQQQQETLMQSYGAANVPLPHSRPPPPLEPGVCSPIAMAGFYARNYLDHYSMAYSYNPTMAAAASLWNSAAILQYPLMRPASGLLNGQQPSQLSPSNLSFPGSPMSQRTASYRVPIQQQQHQQRSEAKRMIIDGDSMSYGSRDANAKLHANGISSSVGHAKKSPDYQHCTVATAQPRISLNSVGPEVAANYKNLLQQQPQRPQQHPQEQQAYGRSYGEARLPVTGSGWRTSHLLGPMSSDYNYTGINAWPPNSPIPNTHRLANSTPSFVSPSNVIHSSRSSKISKANTLESSNFRKCNTPNLGKVLSGSMNVGNFECSECGRAGPMFKCLGCEVAFYCNENCQARHWKCHVKSCPKKMPKLKKVVH